MPRAARAAPSRSNRTLTAAGAPSRWPRPPRRERSVTMESMGKKFRQLLRDEPYLFTGGIYSPLDAQIAERAGMKSIYLSGYSVAMLNGWPDMGLLTMTEVAKTASMVASAVDAPIIADADDGYAETGELMRAALSRRTGPVFMDIPIDVFFSAADMPEATEHLVVDPGPPPNPDMV